MTGLGFFFFSLLLIFAGATIIWASVRRPGLLFSVRGNHRSYGRMRVWLLRLISVAFVAIGFIVIINNVGARREVEVVYLTSHGTQVYTSGPRSHFVAGSNGRTYSVSAAEYQALAIDHSYRCDVEQYVFLLEPQLSNCTWRS